MSTIEKIVSVIKDAFDSLVGMTAAKNLARENILANKKDPSKKALLSPIILAPAGTGKTALAKAWQKEMRANGFKTIAFDSPAEFRKVSIEGQSSRWEELLAFLVEPGKKSIFIDEAHMLWERENRTVQYAKVCALCLKALDGNNKGIFSVQFSENTEVVIDRREFQIILATNFPKKLPEALGGKNGRLTQIHLELYSRSEIGKIASLMLAEKSLKANEESLCTFADVVRGSARPLEKLVEQLETRCINTGKSSINKEDIKFAMISLEWFPLGFNKIELKCLNYFNKTRSIKELEYGFPELDSGERKALQGYALVHGLIGKTNGGFGLTDKGRRYFSDLPKLGFTVPDFSNMAD